MEGELYNAIQKPNEAVSTVEKNEVTSLPKLSFIPPDLLNKENIAQMGKREKCAFAGMVLGGLALISWIVILFGAVFAVFGIVLSFLGLNSGYKKYARIGLGLSIAGLLASIWYCFAAYSGMVNYNYFTSEFWTSATSTTK